MLRSSVPRSPRRVTEERRRGPNECTNQYPLLETNPLKNHEVSLLEYLMELRAMVSVDVSQDYQLKDLS